MTGTCRMSPMIRWLRTPLTALVALCAALPPAYGAEQEELTWYAVEIIVFERSSEVGRNAEAWPMEPGIPALADALELTRDGLSPQQLAGQAPAAAAEGEQTDSPGEAPAQSEPLPEPPMAAAEPTGLPQAFQLLPEEDYRLAEAWKRLDASSAFRPLLHIAWVQPGYPQEQARLVHLRNANAALGTVAPAVDADLETPPPGSQPVGSGATLASRVIVARDPSRAALDGTVRVHRARYLHVAADLLYYRPLPGDSPLAAADSAAGASPVPDSPDTGLIEQLMAEENRYPRLFRLTESRRMRSRELHYLDHPLFGMLVEIVPLELPEMPLEAVLPSQGETPSEQIDSEQPATNRSGG